VITPLVTFGQGTLAKVFTLKKGNNEGIFSSKRYRGCVSGAVVLLATEYIRLQTTSNG